MGRTFTIHAGPGTGADAATTLEQLADDVTAALAPRPADDPEPERWPSGGGLWPSDAGGVMVDVDGELASSPGLPFDRYAWWIAMDAHGVDNTRNVDAVITRLYDHLVATGRYRLMRVYDFERVVASTDG